MERLQRAISALQLARRRGAPQDELDAALYEYEQAVAMMPASDDFWGAIDGYLVSNRAKWGLGYEGKGPAEPTPKLEFVRWRYLTGRMTEHPAPEG